MKKFGIILTAITGLAASSAANEPIAVSTSTISDPYAVIFGVTEATPQLQKAPWFNESLEFGIEWGFISVGKAVMEVRRFENFNGTPTARIEVRANSNKFCDNFYKVRDINESWVNANDFSSMGYKKRLREGGFFRDEWVMYDYQNKTFVSKSTNRDNSFSVKVGTIPGQVQDVLSSLYYIRTKPLNVGEEIIMDVNTRTTWPLVVKVLRKETIKVPAGKFNCIVVQPFLRKEGIFIQKGKDLKVWLTDDERRLPVQLSVEVFFGHVTATLLKSSH